MKAIPNCVPHIAGNEEKYLAECVRTGWLSQVGPFVDRFEQMFADYHGLERAAAVSSGTAAIHLGLIALGVRAGDLVICPDITFVGSVNPILYCGADPILIGVDPETLNLDPAHVLDFITREVEMTASGLIHKKTGRRISALQVVHLYGTPAEMDPIMELADRFRLPVLEDCAESLGARYQGKQVGTIGTIGCFSFNGNKVITTGGGGMVISRNPDLVRLCKHLSTQAKTDAYEFIHDHIGYNYRLSNVCAAVGVAQMERLEEYLQLKREHAAEYKRLLEACPGKARVLDRNENRFNTHWMVMARLCDPIPRDAFRKVKELADSGIGVRPMWFPVHQQPAYKGRVLYSGKEMEGDLYQSTFCLPSSVGLGMEDIHRVVDALMRSL